ncbi:hypothetical protein N7I30_21070 [Aurantimonas litoralis]|nr:hypothetical protein [Aurantimonas litoralis]
MCPQTWQIELAPAMLKRGFWLYVFRAYLKDEAFLYVGRTGDNRPPQAASPYDRFGQHLGITNAAANGFRTYLSRRMAGHSDVSIKSLDFRCWGPIFEPVISKSEFDKGNNEQRDAWAKEHSKRRKIVGGLERRLAEELAFRGYSVLNTVRDGNDIDPKLWGQIERSFLPQFPDVRN